MEYTDGSKVMEFKSDPQVVFDSSTSTRKSHSGASASEWRNFMSSKPSDMFRKPCTRKFSEQMHSHEEEEVFKTIFKEVEQLGTAQMTWKQRKVVEKQKVLALGGKPPKNIRMPIEMGKKIRKKRNHLEQTRMQEEVVLGRPAKRANKTDDRHKTEDRGLKASEGIFKNGVLHVKPLVKNVEKCDESVYRIGKERKMKGKKHKGKRKQ